MAENFYKQVENTVGKGEICLLRAIPPFPTAFSKNLYCRHVKTWACLGKGINRQHFEFGSLMGLICVKHSKKKEQITKFYLSEETNSYRTDIDMYVEFFPLQ